MSKILLIANEPWFSAPATGWGISSLYLNIAFCGFEIKPFVNTRLSTFDAFALRYLFLYGRMIKVTEARRVVYQGGEKECVVGGGEAANHGYEPAQSLIIHE
jgi:hypothetical protein